MSNKEKLSYPSVKTFFICYNDERTEIKSYGSISPKQCLVCNWIEIDYFTEQKEWTKILLENEIEIDE